jgi:hypothetical protein
MGKISTAGVLRLRATSAVSRDKSVRRSAQDDDFVEVSTKNILKKLARMALRTGLLSAVPGGTGSRYPYPFSSMWMRDFRLSNNCLVDLVR